MGAPYAGHLSQRSFDQAPDALQALEDVEITTGCSRILTSGPCKKQPSKAPQYYPSSYPSPQVALVIMPGGGVSRSSNIAQLIHEIGAPQNTTVPPLLATNSYHTADELEIKILTTTLLNK